MKRVLLALLIAGVTAVASPTTIKTLDGHTYTNAEVVKVEPDGITVFSDAGVKRISFVNLPAGLQKQYGYDLAKTAEFDGAKQAERMEALSQRLVQTKAEGKATLAAIKSASLGKAAWFYGKRESDIEDLFGAPTKIWNGGTYEPDRILFYETEKGKVTMFGIDPKDDTVNGGLFKGFTIRNPKHVTHETKPNFTRKGAQ